MRFDFKHNSQQTIEFLNLSAETFYNGKVDFLDRSYDGRLRANLLGGMLDIERTIRGSFGCDFSLSTANVAMLKEMYPNACNNLLKIECESDKEKLSYYLTSLRNLNAHSFLSDEDIEFLKGDFSFLDNQKKMHGELKYTTNGKITIAGIIFLIINFHRAQSIKTLISDDFLVGVVACGKYQFDNGERFVKEINHVDLEINIRQKSGDDVLSSVFGEYMSSVTFEDKKFTLIIGKENYPTFIVSGSLNKDILSIDGGTLTRTYYTEPFVIKIDDEKEFINFCNKLPMMASVDYLYESEIKEFNRAVFKQLQKDNELISKLNKPKFYADKSLSLLLFKSNASDFRITSSLIVGSVSRLFLATENYIYRTRKISRGNRYSTIGSALRYVGVPEEIITEVTYLRNFCAHGYILNDYLLYKDDVRQFTLEYVVSTIKKLSDYLENNVRDLHNNFKEYKREFLINKIIKTKYKIAIAYSDVVINEFPNYDRGELAKKMGFINNSFYDITMFNQITNFEIQKYRVIELYLSDVKQCLYFYENESSRNKIDYFCSCFRYEISSEKDLGLIIEMTAKKIK